MTESHSSSDVLTSIRSRTKPALLTRMSSPPYVSIACRTIDSAWAKSATSAPLVTASPPSARISATTASAGDSSFSPASETPKSLTTTFAPCRASSSACARPMPRPAPVTIAIRPARRVMRAPW